MASIPTMAAAAGLLYAAGGSLALTSLSVTTPRPHHIEPMLGLCIIAVISGVTTLGYGRGFPRWVYHALVDAGTLLITAVVYLAGHSSESLGFGCVYALVALDCFLFFA